MPLFDRYYFSDYSGAGNNDTPQKGIRLFMATAASETIEERRPSKGIYFSRNSLRIFMLAALAKADHEKERVIFGFDHQYSWPLALWNLFGLTSDWRTSIKALRRGPGKLPQLDTPSKFCKTFNKTLGLNVFWTPLRGIAERYGIPSSPQVYQGIYYRMTEHILQRFKMARPKAANVVGGQGPGAVGGQTICGLYQIAKMLESRYQNIGWWPFDGVDIHNHYYSKKHIAIEIYPEILRRKGIKKSDKTDAQESCRLIRDLDLTGNLTRVLSLGSHFKKHPFYKSWVMKEGWIIGTPPFL